MHAYARALHLAEMAEHVAPSKLLVSLCRMNIGCPKKFSQPWNSVMKRINITAGKCMKFRQLKKANRFHINDSTS